MRAPGSLSLRSLIDLSKFAVKLATDVIVASLLVQTSLAPISIDDVVDSLFDRSSDLFPQVAHLAPDLASLNRLPLAAALPATMRS